MSRASFHLCFAPAVGLIALACPVDAAAQCEPAWVLRVGKGPGPREGHTLTYDPVRARLILLGGTVGTAPPLLETWAFDTSSGIWLLSPAVGPAGRSGHAAVYDSNRARLVLFGGGPGFGDTWEFDVVANQWVNRLPAQGPSPRSGHAMAYDSARRRVVLFGGQTSLGISTETWEWDGAAGTWELRSTVGPPNSNYYGQGGAAFDASRGRTVLVSPSLGSLYEPWETWEWNASAAAWQQRSPAQPPKFVQPTAMGYDPTRSRVVAWASYYLSRGTWEFDGAGAGTWTFAGGGGPSDRRGPAIAIDTVRDRIFLFGGSLLPNGPTSAELWERDPSLPTNIVVNSLPQDRVAAIGQPLELSVSVSGIAPLSFQWRRSGQALANGGHISGADTATLRLTPFLATDASAYDTRVTDACGYSLVTPFAGIRNNCVPDCDQNGLLSVIDFGCYLDHFAAACDNLPQPCYANCDGSTRPPVLNILDFMCFLNAFAAGCP